MLLLLFVSYFFYLSFFIKPEVIIKCDFHVNANIYHNIATSSSVSESINRQLDMFVFLFVITSITALKVNVIILNDKKSDI